MKDILKVLIFVVGMISVLMLIMGTLNAVGGSIYSNCHSEMSRIEYVIPTYRIGCWLGSKP